MSFLRKQLFQRFRAPALSARLMSSNVPLLLSPTQLRDLLLLKKRVSILDASWFMPNSPRKPGNEFLSKRIPSALFLDLDEVASTHELGLKHMMPNERVFAGACEKFGIEPSSHVVIYDSHGIFSSPRALFMFRAFGHQKSSIIDGGLPRWEAEGLPVETAPPPEQKKSHYPTPNLNASAIRNYEQVISNSILSPSTASDAEFLLDARSRGRYVGTDPEPRPGLSSGHVPHSLSLPFTMFLQKHSAPNSSEYTTFLSKPDLHRALVEALGTIQAETIIKGQASVITSCGSGMTAAVLWLGLRLLGLDSENISLYDESWTGYAMRKSSKIEKSF